MPYWFFFETVLLCSSGWPQLYNCHASVSQGWDHRCEPWAIHSMFPMVQVKKKNKTLSFQIHIKKSSPWEIYPWYEFSLWLPPFPLGWLTVISLSDCDDGFQLTSLSSPLWLHSFTYGPLTLFWFFTFSDVPSLIHPEFSLQLCPLAVPSGSKVLLWYALPAHWHTSASFLFLCGPGREHPWPTHLGMWYSTA